MKNAEMGAVSEVDLRWGIANDESGGRTLRLGAVESPVGSSAFTRSGKGAGGGSGDRLKAELRTEIRACRPFFIGLLGERYGWVPGADAFTADLQLFMEFGRWIHSRQ